MSFGRGSSRLGRGGAPGRRITGGQWSVVHARETRRRLHPLGRGLARSYCARGSETTAASIGGGGSGADRARAGGFPNRRWGSAHTSVDGCSEDRQVSNKVFSGFLNYAQKLANTKLVEGCQGFNFPIGSLV